MKIIQKNYTNKTIKEGDVAPWSILKDLNKNKRKEQRSRKRDYIFIRGRIVKRLHFFVRPFSSIFICFHPYSSTFIHFNRFHSLSTTFIHFHTLSTTLIFFHLFSTTFIHCHMVAFFSFFQMRLKGTLESLNLYEFPKKKTPNELWPPIASSDWWDVQKLKWNCKLSLSTYINEQNFHLIEIFILSND